MNKSTKLIEFNELKPGMVVAKDIIQDGRILIRKGYSVTVREIQKLKNTLFLEKIAVYYDEQSSEEGKLARKRKEEFEMLEQEFTEMSVRLQRTFRILNGNGDDSSSLNELKEFSDKIQNELKPSSMIIKNIVLHGSGTDSVYRHGVNVSALSALIGKWLNMEKKDITNLTYSAILHDIGKLKVNKDILNKPTSLTTSEYNVIKTHSNMGYKLLKDVSYLDKSVLYGVLMHHEREDGSGYPLGLKGEAIHPFAKIIAIADVFDAINSNRGYKKKKSPFEALQIVKNESLGRLDYEYCKVFLQHIVNYYLGEEALLNNGQKCKIIQMNVNDLERPLILINDDFVDLSKDSQLQIDELIL